MSVFCVRREDSPGGTVQSLESTSTSSMGERGGTVAGPCFVSAEKTAPVGPYVHMKMENLHRVTKSINTPGDRCLKF
jgi:hypothetical protein